MLNTQSILQFLPKTHTTAASCLWASALSPPAQRGGSPSPRVFWRNPSLGSRSISLISGLPSARGWSPEALGFPSFIFLTKESFHPKPWRHSRGDSLPALLSCSPTSGKNEGTFRNRVENINPSVPLYSSHGRLRPQMHPQTSRRPSPSCEPSTVGPQLSARWRILSAFSALLWQPLPLEYLPPSPPPSETHCDFEERCLPFLRKWCPSSHPVCCLLQGHSGNHDVKWLLSFKREAKCPKHHLLESQYL